MLPIGRFEEIDACNPVRDQYGMCVSSLWVPADPNGAKFCQEMWGTKARVQTEVNAGAANYYS